MLIACMALIGLSFYQYNHQYQVESSFQLPRLKLSLDKAQSQLQINQLLADIRLAENASALPPLHQALIEQTEKSYNAEQNKLLAALQLNLVQRITSASAENDRIYTLLLLNLSTLSQLAEQQQMPLWQNMIDGWIASAKILNLQTSPEQLELFVEQVEQGIVLLQGQSSNASQTEFEQQLDKLNMLMLGEQSFSSRWRGYIRLYQEYLTALTNIFTSEPNNQVQHTGSNLQPSWLEQNINKLGVGVSSTNILLTLVLTSCGFFLLFLVLFSRMITTAKRHNQQILTDIQQTIAGQFNQANTPETAAIEKELSSLAQVEVSQSQLEQCLENYQKQQLQLFALTDTVQWFVRENGLELMLPRSQDIVFGSKVSEISHWPKILGFQQSKSLIKACRRAQKEQEIVTVPVLVNQQQLNIIIAYDSYWLGVICDNQQAYDLAEQVSQLSLQLDKNKSLAATIAEKQSEKLTSVLSDAMALDSSKAGHILQHNQLLQSMYDLFEQQRIFADLLYTNKRYPLFEENFVKQVKAALLNIAAHPQLKAHQVILDIDDEVRCSVIISAELFQHLMMQWLKVITRHLGPSKVLVTLSVADQDAGAQQIKFAASVQTPLPISDLPVHIQQMVGSVSVNPTSYFCILLQNLHGTAFQASVDNAGFNTEFVLPIASAKSQRQLPAVCELLQTSILVVTSNPFARQVWLKYLKRAGANVDSVIDINQFAARFDAYQNNLQKLDLVIYADQNLEELPSIKKQVSEGSNNKTKILVINTPQLTLGYPQDIYSLSNIALLKGNLLAECLAAIKQPSDDNLTIAQHQLPQQSKTNARTEVLLVVTKQTGIGVLWQLLIALGLKVNVVCSQPYGQQLWQSGRYQLLVSDVEITSMPASQPKLKRGIIGLGKEQSLWLDELVIHNDNWQLASIEWPLALPQVLDVFAPWLVRQQAPQQEVNASKEVIQQTLDAQIPSAFDIAQYTKNQGAPELAVYMLDHYLELIGELASEIELAFLSVNRNKAEHAAKQLHKVANIIAAKGLIELTSQLEQAIENRAWDKIERLLAQIKLEISSITTYAEAI